MPISQEEFEEWVVLQEQLSYIKEREMELRRRISDGELNVNDTGSKKFSLYGKLLHVSQTESISVDEKILAENWDMLTDADRTCIKYKPSLDKRLYDKLPDNSVLRLNICTRRINAPVLKLVG